MRSKIAVWSPARVGKVPDRVITIFTARKAIRSGALWGCIFGLTIASSALGYVAAYKTTSTRANFAAIFGTNAGLDAIAGPATDLQTVGGYTAWKCLAFLSVLGAVWGLLIGTKSLRGEEDAGRWEVFLAGQTTGRRAVMQVLFGLYVGLAVMFVVTASIAVVVGEFPSVRIPVDSMVYFALAAVCSAVVFLAAGAFASQLAATRRQAAGFVGAVLGASYALSMVADSGTGLAWLRWTTPIGWTEELQPLTSPHPFALLPFVCLAAVLSVGAISLADKRDLGSSVIPDRTSARAHTRLLFGPIGLAIRVMRLLAGAWLIAIAATALLLGLVSKQAGRSFTNTPSIEKVFEKLGARGIGAQSYLGISFLIIVLLLAFFAIGQVHQIRAEEAQGHLEHFLVRQSSRCRWLYGRLFIGGFGVVAFALTAGVFAWFGAASEHAGINPLGLIGAGFNLVPSVLFIFGVGVLTFGLWPRGTTGVTYGLLAWSFLVELVGGATNLNHWLLDTSVLHQMTPAPAVPPNWTTGGIVIVMALVLMLVGSTAFMRRDLVGD